MLAPRVRLLIVGFALMGLAWMFSTPPFGAPDEAAHYVRALTIAEGHLVGPRVPIDGAGEAALAAGSWHAQEQRWIDHDRRGVFVTPALSPPGELCLDDRPDRGNGCTEVTYTGDYFPLAYALPAAAISVSTGWRTALWLARAASLLLVLGFVALALAFSGRRSRRSMLGVMAAITPTALFIGAVLNPSGVEIAAALALGSGLLELATDPHGFPWWGWIGLAVASATTVLAWQLGVFFTLAYLATWCGLVGRSGARELLVTARRQVGLVGVVIVVSALLFAIYAAVTGVVHSDVSLTPFLTNLHAGREQFTAALRGAIGDFGAYDIPLPSALSLAWLVGVLTLFAIAIRQGSRRERLVLGSVFVFAIAFPVLFYGFSYRDSGFGLQGRYVLPALALVPLAAGHVIDHHADQAVTWLTPRIQRLAILAIAAFQFVAWWVNAHHWAGGSSLTLAHAAWSPPLGWWPLLAASIAGALTLSASEFVSATSGSPGPQSPAITASRAWLRRLVSRRP